MERTVLVIDDSVDDRALVRRYLGREQKFQYELREATSGAEGLEMIERDPPDVVILDQHLGAMSGNEVLTIMRERGYSEVAVVVLTGSEPLGRDPLELGADDFINKEELNGTYLRRTVENAIVKARMRNRLECSQAQLREALDEVTRRMEFEGRLMAVVSHDLRSPLQSLQIGIDALHGEALSPLGKRTVELVSRSVDHMVRMVGQLLDLTRTRTEGGFPLVRAEVDLSELVVVRVDELRNAHPERRIECECEGETTGWFDPTAFGQLVHNLVGNALGHGSRQHPVCVDLVGRDHEVELRVTNRGRPIEPERLVNIFEPFARGSASTEGLGLGLYIAHEIARAHGGRIEVTSDRERTIFCAVLPRPREGPRPASG